MVPTWVKHLHVNGTIYYSLDCRNRSWTFQRILTAENLANLDNQGIIEDCGLEYHQWLEEADLEDLPDDLELVVFFDNPQSKIPIGTFMSHGKEIKFACCPLEDTSVALSYFVPLFESHSVLTHLTLSSDDDDPPVVVTVAVHPKQSFWLASESYPMHYARSHPKEEGDFLAALAYSAHGKAKHS